MSTTEQSIPATAEEVHYCEAHPDRETNLRCNKCGRYMCVQCAVLTPVGYRCKQCVRQHEDKFYPGTTSDYLVVFATCAALGVVAGFVARYVPFFLFAFIIGIPVGGFISEIALRLSKRRRGRRSGEIGAAGVVLGGLAGGMIQAAAQYGGSLPEGAAPALSLDTLLPFVLNDISLLIFIGVIAFVVYGRFRMKF